MRTGYACKQPRFPVERQEEILRAAGVKRIYVEGRGLEDLAAALRAVRGDEVLETVGGYRSFGMTRAEIMVQVAVVEKSGKVLQDVETGLRSDKNGASLLDSALKKIKGEKSIGSSERAREMGSAGGIAKGKKAAADRMPEEKARKIWFNLRLPSNQAAIDRMTNWSRETAYRKFGPSGRPTGRRGTKE